MTPLYCKNSNFSLELWYMSTYLRGLKLFSDNHDISFRIRDSKGSKIVNCENFFDFDSQVSIPIPIPRIGKFSIPIPRILTDSDSKSWNRNSSLIPFQPFEYAIYVAVSRCNGLVQWIQCTFLEIKRNLLSYVLW